MGRGYHNGIDHDKEGMRHLFSYWGRLKKALKGKFVYLFLDYDGTLVPIVRMPGEAVISDRTKALLRRLSKMIDYRIAIVSGRALGDISRRVGLKNIVYVGNHGLEIKGPKISFKSRLPVRYRRTLEKIKDDLKGSISSVKGVLIEDKGLSLSIHYRAVGRNDISQVNAALSAAVSSPGVKGNVRVRSGKMVWDIIPPVKWDKGMAVLWLLKHMPFRAADRPLRAIPIYIGDDFTDEDAFKALRSKGMTVLVGHNNASCAQYYLKDTHEVIKLIERLSTPNNSKVSRT